MKELLKKMQLISQELMSIDKDMTVGKGNYSYKAVSDLAVTKRVKEAESKYNVISVPARQELIKSEIVKTLKEEGKESITYVDTIKMTVIFTDLDSGESMEIETYGRGLDSGDKGFGKASTYARKYALLNAYKIATGEDPDADPSKESKTITTNEKTTLVLDFFSKNNDYANNVFSHFGVSSSDELSDTHIKQVYKSLKDKQRI